MPKRNPGKSQNPGATFARLIKMLFEFSDLSRYFLFIFTVILTGRHFLKCDPSEKLIFL